MVALERPQNSPLCVAAIAGKGRGIITTRSVPCGQILEWSPVLAFPGAERDTIDQSALFPYYFVRPGDYAANRRGAEGLIVLGLATLCNHADSPNARIEWLEEPDGPAARLVAERAIGLGEEVTLRYANIDDYPAASDFI